MPCYSAQLNTSNIHPSSTQSFRNSDEKTVAMAKFTRFADISASPILNDLATASFVTSTPRNRSNRSGKFYLTFQGGMVSHKC